jgi:hypothetical protein
MYLFDVASSSTNVAGTGTSSSSQISSTFMDEDDIEEFLSLPIVRNVYFDPKTQLLHIDPTLGNVIYIYIYIYILI